LPADPASALSSGEQQQGARLRATAAGDAGVEGVEPAFRNGLQPVQRTREHAGDGTGRVRVAAAIDDIDQAVLKAVAVVQPLQHRLQRLDDPAAWVLAARAVAERQFGMYRQQ